MITLSPEAIDGAIVCNLIEPCTTKNADCDVCQEQTIYIHNWLVETELKYLVVDLQDEKHICPQFIQALLHLKKRLRFPFLFAGVVDRPKEILSNYDYSEFPFFVTPEDAVRALRMAHPSITEGATDKVKMGKPISGAKRDPAEVEIVEEDAEV